MATSRRPFGGRQFLIVGGQAAGRIKAVVETARQFVEVRRHAGPSRRVPGVETRTWTADAVSSRSTSAIAATSRARCRSLSGPSSDAASLVGEPVKYGSLGHAAGGEASRPHPPVGLAPLDDDKPVALERAQQPAEIAGVQVKPRPEQPDIAAVVADLPQQARLPERPAAGQEAPRSARRPVR